VRVWDPATDKRLRDLKSHDRTVAAFSPDGPLLATGGYDRTIRLWDVAAGKLLRTLAARGDLVCFPPDARLLGMAARQLNRVVKGEDAIGDLQFGWGDEAIVIGGDRWVSNSTEAMVNSKRAGP
jgi:WD40 repeat protein